MMWGKLLGRSFPHAPFKNFKENVMGKKESVVRYFTK